MQVKQLVSSLWIILILVLQTCPKNFWKEFQCLYCLHVVPYYTALLCYSIPTPLHSTPLNSTPLHSTLLLSTPLNSILLHSTYLYATAKSNLLCSSLPYPILLYSTLLWDCSRAIEDIQEPKNFMLNFQDILCRVYIFNGPPKDSTGNQIYRPPYKVLSKFNNENLGCKQIKISTKLSIWAVASFRYPTVTTLWSLWLFYKRSTAIDHFKRIHTWMASFGLVVLKWL